MAQIALDTFGGRIHVEGDPAAAVTPLGQLPFFIQFLKGSGVFEAWVADCPLAYYSIHASDTRAVLITSTPYEILALAQLYRDRTDAERLRAILTRGPSDLVDLKNCADMTR